MRWPARSRLGSFRSFGRSILAAVAIVVAPVEGRSRDAHKRRRICRRPACGMERMVTRRGTTGLLPATPSPARAVSRTTISALRTT